MPLDPPLGSLTAFDSWDQSRPWGRDGDGRVTFGSGETVVDDLIRGIAELPATVDARWPVKAEAYPVVLGCVPWLTSQRFVAALDGVPSCIVIDKVSQNYRCVQEFARRGTGMGQHLLQRLGTWGPRGNDGAPPVIGPSGPLPGDREIGPVRVVGYDTNPSRNRKPLLHAKVVVLCGAWQWEGEAGGYDDHLTPLAVWTGSANFTDAADAHVECGVWSRDEQLCATALDFLTAVVEASEPVGSAAPGPLPELAPGEYDDDAFAEWAEQVQDDDRP